MKTGSEAVQPANYERVALETCRLAKEKRLGKIWVVVDCTFQKEIRHQKFLLKNLHKAILKVSQVPVQDLTNQRRHCSKCKETYLCSYICKDVGKSCTRVETCSLPHCPDFAVG